jgi:predicted Zn-dependent protease
LSFRPAVASHEKLRRTGVVIPTSRHLQYALGYLGLGLLKEAEAEMKAIHERDRHSPEVLSCWIDLHLARKRWRSLKTAGRRLTEIDPQQCHGWVMWAYALRELNEVETALAVLSRAQPLHGGKHAIIHYNLACYHCLLGDRPSARVALATAFQMDARFRLGALEDPDLATMRAEIAAMD